MCFILLVDYLTICCWKIKWFFSRPRKIRSTDSLSLSLFLSVRHTPNTYMHTYNHTSTTYPCSFSMQSEAYLLGILRLTYWPGTYWMFHIITQFIFKCTPIPTHFISNLLSCALVWPDGYIIFQYLPNCNNDNVPKGIDKFPKNVQHFAKHKVNSQAIVNDFKNVPTSAKFRQIWSHCCAPTQPPLLTQSHNYLCLKHSSLTVSPLQCDQIGRFIGLRQLFKAFGNN